MVSHYGPLRCDTPGRVDLQYLNLIGIVCSMGVQDRDWYREEQRRKRKLDWNERTGEMELDRTPSKRRWRWPYRLRPEPSGDTARSAED
jgi:hypothetical protein